MTGSIKQKAPAWFMVVAVVALLWNLLGVFAFLSQVTMSPEALAQLPQDQREMITLAPTWLTVVFAVAVNFGALGCLLLILKKNLAGLFLQLSLAAVLIQQYYIFFMTKGVVEFEMGTLAMPVMIVLVAFYLVALAIQAKRRHWTT